MNSSISPEMVFSFAFLRLVVPSGGLTLALLLKYFTAIVKNERVGERERYREKCASSLSTATCENFQNLPGKIPTSYSQLYSFNHLLQIECCAKHQGNSSPRIVS